MAFKITKEWLKTMAKEDSAVVAFFIGAYLLATGLDIIPEGLMTAIVVISVSISFGVVVIKIVLKAHRSVVLYWEETKVFKRNKDFTKIDKSFFEQAISSAKEVTLAIAEIKKELAKKSK